jgi:hypothetical protein
VQGIDGDGRVGCTGAVDQRKRVTEGSDLRGHHELKSDAESVRRAQVAQGREAVAEAAGVRVVAVDVNRARPEVGRGLQRLLESLDAGLRLDAADGRVEEDHAGVVQAQLCLPAHRGVAEHREAGPARRRELNHEADGGEARSRGDVHDRGRFKLGHGVVTERERAHAGRLIPGSLRRLPAGRSR